MKIALIHYRAGLMDGVSLEMEKWKSVLESMGYTVDIVAGNKNPKVDKTLPSLDFEDSYNKKLLDLIFENPTQAEKDIWKKSKDIEKELEEGLKEYDVLIPNNVLSLGWNIPLGIALTSFIKNSKKSVIAHHHDFWWERDFFLKMPQEIREVLSEYFPPKLENIKHVVINSIAQKELKRRKNVESIVVPNVLDFNAPSWISEKVRDELRERFEISKNDLVFLQATRIVRRKAIELAIDLIKEFSKLSEGYKGKKMYNDEEFSGRSFLVFIGMAEKNQLDYKEFLLEYAKSKNVKVIDMSELTDKEYSFFEMYSVADVVTYPSILEGWGNQLLEAIFAKKPVVLFEYEIFVHDIKPTGLKYISLGNRYEKIDNRVVVDKEIIEKAARKLLNVVFDKDLYLDYVNTNFEIGKRYFSFETLKNKILSLGLKDLKEE